MTIDVLTYLMTIDVLTYLMTIDIPTYLMMLVMLVMMSKFEFISSFKLNE